MNKYICQFQSGESFPFPNGWSQNDCHNWMNKWLAIHPHEEYLRIITEHWDVVSSVPRLIYNTKDD